jgi:hypothetical protein
MKKITLHVDLRAAFLGQIILVTDNATGEPVSYGVEPAKPSEIERFSTGYKTRFHNCETDQDRKAVSKYFTEMMGSAQMLDTYGAQLPWRYPSLCAYTFDSTDAPTEDDPPFNLDYGLCRAVTPLVIENRARLTVCLDRAKKEAFDQVAGCGFPGLSKRPSFLRALRSLECPDVEDDVVSEPWYADYLAQWQPSVREDGYVGLFESATDPARGYLVTESALPYFVCDQLICLVRQNPDAWTWAQWAVSDEVCAAAALALQSVEAIEQRVLETLSVEPAVVRAAEDRLSSEKLSMLTNVLRKSPEAGVVYDAEIVRADDWHKHKAILVRFVAGADASIGYALVKNTDFGCASFDGVLPATFYVASAEDAAITIKNAFKKELRNMITVDVLVEIV